jgi:hypothetical protein
MSGLDLNNAVRNAPTPIDLIWFNRLARMFRPDSDLGAYVQWIKKLQSFLATPSTSSPSSSSSQTSTEKLAILSAAVILRTSNLKVTGKASRVLRLITKLIVEGAEPKINVADLYSTLDHMSDFFELYSTATDAIHPFKFRY